MDSYPVAILMHTLFLTSRTHKNTSKTVDRTRRGERFYESCVAPVIVYLKLRRAASFDI